MANAASNIDANTQSIQLFVQIAGYPDLIILDFDGTMGLSTLYQFSVNILSKQLIDDDKLLGGKVTLSWQLGTLKYAVSGMIHDWQINDDNITLKNYYSYSFTIVPLVSQLQHNKRIATYLNQTLPTIISQILNQSHIPFRLDLQKSYPEKNFVFQYQETDWNFISRWLERLGMFYYFEHDGTSEILVITDSNNALHADPVLKNLNYQHYSQNPPLPTETRLWQFALKKQRAPKNLTVVAYDHNKASQQISTEITVDPLGQGDVEVWQEDLLSPTEVHAYAEILKNTYLWQTAVFTGSVEQRLIPGTYVSVDNTYQESWNKKNYLILECHFVASQRSAIFASGSESEPTSSDVKRIFSCTFAAIPLTQAFCPLMLTKAPKVGGMIPAFIIDSTNSNIPIPINHEGCYQVAFSAQPQAQTYWLRMCQHYTGDNFGTMAPLHAGTEVMLGFLYANCDLPIIAHAVFNSTSRSTFNQSNSQESGIISANNNRIILTDKTDGNSILLSSPTGESRFTVGKDSSSGSTGVSMWTTGDTTSYTRGNSSSVTEGCNSDVLLGAKTGLTMGAWSDMVVGSKLGVVAGIHTELCYSMDFRGTLTEVFHQAQAKFHEYTVSHTTVVGATVKATTPAAIIYTTPDFTVEADAAITLQVGATIVSITDVGIIIYAPTLEITSDMVTVTAGDINLMGNVSISGDLEVLGQGTIMGGANVLCDMIVSGVTTLIGDVNVEGEVIME